MTYLSKRQFRLREQALLEALPKVRDARAALRGHPDDAKTPNGQRLSSSLADFSELVAGYCLWSARLGLPQHPSLAAWRVGGVGKQ